MFNNQTPKTKNTLKTCPKCLFQKALTKPGPKTQYPVEHKDQEKLCI